MWDKSIEFALTDFIMFSNCLNGFSHQTCLCLMFHICLTDSNAWKICVCAELYILRRTTWFLIFLKKGWHTLVIFYSRRLSGWSTGWFQLIPSWLVAWIFRRLLLNFDDSSPILGWIFNYKRSWWWSHLCYSIVGFFILVLVQNYNFVFPLSYIMDKKCTQEAN